MKSFAFLFALALTVLPAAVARPALSLDIGQAIRQYENLLWQPVNDWRVMVGDVSNGQSPDLDDSMWKTGSPEYEWGDEPIAWLRKTILIPQTAAGKKVTLYVGIDDSGEGFINGKPAGAFHWDAGKWVLTEKAKPGDRYVIALKGINTGGPGRLLMARIEYGDGRKWVGEAHDFQAQVDVCRAFAKNAEPQGSGPLHDILKRAEEALDVSALESSDTGRFRLSMAEARKRLLDFDPMLKQHTLSLVGHAHIDMNWLWLWPETVEVCKVTFTSATNLMDEFPGFRFSQSQPSTYVAVQEADPPLFRKIQQRAKEKLWEITGGTWVEGDMNMASGEAICRQILYAKRYFRKWFGFEPRICWEPDTFGHAWTIPQILREGELEYYYFCRCGKGERMFWWEGPDGSRVLAYNDGGYSGDVRPSAVNRLLAVNETYGVKRDMVVYGVGDHGGGPTRESVEQGMRMRELKPYPTVKFDRAEWLYDGIRRDLGKADLLSQKGPDDAHRGKTTAPSKPGLPIIRDELNYTFEGCYTTHSDIKKSNRELENLLPTAEAFSVFSLPLGGRYDSASFETAWRNVCFNQFHDIFDGSAIHGAYEYSAGLADVSRKIGQDALSRSLDAIAKNVDTRGDGIPVLVFNPSSWPRTDLVSVPLAVENSGSLTAVDASGRASFVQKAVDKLHFTAVGVPSFGYKLYRLIEGPVGDGAAVFSDGSVLENEFFRVTVDKKRGTITGIHDKRRRREILPERSEAAVLQVLWEKPHGMSAWFIGEIEKTTPITDTVSSEVTSNGPTIAAVKLDYHYGKSKLAQEIRLYRDVPRIDIKFTADWQELGDNDRGSPMLKVAFPADVQAREFAREIPFGSIAHACDGQEVPALKWIDMSDKGHGLSLLNDCKYGHDVKDNVMRLTLLRASYDPDPTPDQGRHEVTYSIYPHLGDWRVGETVRRGYELNNPLIAIPVQSHSGKLPASKSFLGVSAPNVIVSSVKKAEDRNSTIIRLYESSGRPTEAQIVFGSPISRWREVNTLERPKASGWRDVGADRIGLRFGRWQIKTIEVETP